MVRAGDLFGDGVNIAARLQTLATPGTVCISGATSGPTAAAWFAVSSLVEHKLQKPIEPQQALDVQLAVGKALLDQHSAYWPDDWNIITADICCL